jgi:hypothetical protein
VEPVSWAALFERASEHETTTEAIRNTLDTVREERGARSGDE